LKVRSPLCSSIALPCFISFGYSSAIVFIGFDVFFQFEKKFDNAFRFVTGQM
jgi:hypothetical protein